MSQRTLTKVEAAGRWLVDYMASVGGEARAVDVLTAGEAAGFNRRTLYHARSTVGVERTPGSYRWRLIEAGTRRCPHCGGLQ